MNSALYDILNSVDEGIIILNERLEICFWNHYMEILTGNDYQIVQGHDIYKILPRLDKNYFHQAVDNVFFSGNKMFFSAALHKEIINRRVDLNLKISRFEKDQSKFILIELIDVTNQMVQINRLKDFVMELCNLNKKLKDKETLIKKLAYYDNLTGVANRTLFFELAEKLLNQAKRNNNLLAVLFVDVNKFKIINDVYGHIIGDEVLIEVANILMKATRRNDVVARYGGDEFIILLPSIKNFNDYEAVVSRIIHTKNKRYEEKDINVTLSIGISIYPEAGENLEQLISQADEAMYIAKKSDGEKDKFYNAHWMKKKVKINY